MYTNIDVDHDILIIQLWFHTFQHKLPPNFPSLFLITAITIIMKNNIFTFGNTNWLQRTGTTMGTPCTYMLATLYYSYHERTMILPKYSTNILFYHCYIDDVICLWTSPNNDMLQSNHTYQCLQTNMNNSGKLRWEFKTLTTSTTFLDSNITLNTPKHNKTLCQYQYQYQYQPQQPISFSTYQQEHNLYLYLPPYSAHPPGITRSLIHGLLHKYLTQNTHLQDFHKMTKLLFQYLLARGHPKTTLHSLFLQAATNIDKNRHRKLLYVKTTIQWIQTQTRSSYIQTTSLGNNCNIPTITPVNSDHFLRLKASATSTQTTAQP